MKVWQTSGGAHLIKVDEPMSENNGKTVKRLDWASNEEAINAAIGILSDGGHYDSLT
jgi:hypothetical protein